MTVKDALQRVADALEILRAREHGRLGQRAANIGHRRSYITKLAKTDGYTFARLLKVVEALREEPGRFFARAFDIRPDPDVYLEDLLRPGQEKPVLGRIERVTRNLESQPPPAGQPSTSRAVVGDLTRSCRSDQRKRLRGAKKFQTVSFLRGYLIYLDDLRYENPSDAAFLAETLAREVIELVIATHDERLELQCRALGVYGSAHRLLGDFPTAAKAIVLALQVARRHDLDVTVANLLQRGAYVLSDHAQYNRALDLLKEAQITYSDLELDEMKGKVLIDRAVMVGLQGHQESGLRLFRQALSLLPNDDSATLWRVAAYHGMAILCRQMGNLDDAESLLSRAVNIGVDQRKGIIAKLLWELGSLAAEREDYPKAERLLLKSLRKLSYRDSPLQVCLASLDLLSILLKQRRASHACSLAKELAPVLAQFKGNKIASAAILKLVEAGFAGQVDQALVEQVTKRLKGGRTPATSTPDLDLSTNRQAQ